MTTLIGRTVGKYQLVELLGAGGMARVYRAVQMPLERSVAVKVLHSHLTEQESFRDRFLREGRAIASLHHPHIVQIYDFDSHDGLCYMAMEFLSGTSLEGRLQALAETAGQAPTPLPVAEAVGIVIQVAEALDFAHGQGVVHRDIKPANIMQTLEGRVILTDFGIATIMHQTRLTLDGGTSGTPAYMSPEQALGERGDERSDIYSLGAVLYQLVTGQLPFEADTLFGLIMKHVNEPPPPASQANPEVPLALEQIIFKAMAKSPDERYQTAGALAADLQAVLSGEPVKIELSPGAPTDKMVKAAAAGPARWWWPGLATALLLALLVAGVLAARPVEEGVNSMAIEALDKDAPSMAASGPLVETFSDNSHNWPVTDGPVSRQVVDGVYQVLVTVPDRAVSAYPQGGAVYTDFVYEAEALLLEGQPESGYGLVFRRQDNDNYYVFAVNGLGQWSVWRLESKIWQELRRLADGETWTRADKIRPAGEVNRLKVAAAGPHLRFYVNDEFLLDLKDDTFAAGGIGFYVATSRTAAAARARAQFDNLTVTPLQDTVPSMTRE